MRQPYRNRLAISSCRFQHKSFLLPPLRHSHQIILQLHLYPERLQFQNGLLITQYGSGHLPQFLILSVLQLQSFMSLLCLFSRASIKIDFLNNFKTRKIVIRLFVIRECLESPLERRSHGGLPGGAKAMKSFKNYLVQVIDKVLQFSLGYDHFSLVKPNLFQKIFLRQHSKLHNFWLLLSNTIRNNLYVNLMNNKFSTRNNYRSRRKHPPF